MIEKPLKCCFIKRLPAFTVPIIYSLYSVGETALNSTLKKQTEQVSLFHNERTDQQSTKLTKKSDLLAI